MARKQKRRERLQVPLDQDVWDALQDFAELTGRSKASIADELLTESVPALYQLGNAIQRMKINPASGILKIAEMADRLSQEAKQASLDLGGISKGMANRKRPK